MAKLIIVDVCQKKLGELTKSKEASPKEDEVSSTKRYSIAEKIVAKKEAITPDSAAVKDKENSENFNVAGFANDTKEELAKVVWPTRQQLLSESTAVILMVILVATIIYLVDNLFGWAAGKVF